MSRGFSKAFYNSKEWQRCREYVLRRDNYLCVKCGRPAEEVHHIIHLTPQNIGDVSVTLNPDNLICLCRECHFKEHRLDKLSGLKSREKPASGEEYEFDESGYLVKKNISPTDTPLCQSGAHLREDRWGSPS